jgi:hypothetical protein
MDSRTCHFTKSYICLCCFLTAIAEDEADLPEL